MFYEKNGKTYFLNFFPFMIYMPFSGSFWSFIPLMEYFSPLFVASCETPSTDMGLPKSEYENISFPSS